MQSDKEYLQACMLDTAIVLGLALEAFAAFIYIVWGLITLDMTFFIPGFCLAILYDIGTIKYLNSTL